MPPNRMPSRMIEKTILSNINYLVRLLIDMSGMNQVQKERFLEEAARVVRRTRPYLLSLIDGKEEHLGALIKQLVSQKLPQQSVLDSFGDLQLDLDRVLALALITRPNTRSSSVNTEDELPAENKPSGAENPFDSTEPDTFMTESLEDENRDLVEDSVEIPQDSTPEESTYSIDQTVEEYKEDYFQEDLFPTNNVFSETEPIQNNDDENIETITINVQENEPLESLIRGLFPGLEIVPDYIIRSMKLDYYLPQKKLGFKLLSPQEQIYKYHELLIRKEGINLIKVYPNELNNIRLLVNKLLRLNSP